MPYTIAIFPEFEGLEEIESVIRKYRPNTNELKPHVALVYYFREKPEKGKIDKIIAGFSSFKIRLNKIRAPAEDNYIFLDATEGRREIVKLKDMLYKKLGLKWKGDFLYNPHITLASFETKAEQEMVLKEIEGMDFDFSCKVDSFLLLEMNDDLLTVKSKEKFNLS